MFIQFLIQILVADVHEIKTQPRSLSSEYTSTDESSSDEQENVPETPSSIQSKETPKSTAPREFTRSQANQYLIQRLSELGIKSNSVGISDFNYIEISRKLSAKRSINEEV